MHECDNKFISSCCNECFVSCLISECRGLSHLVRGVLFNQRRVTGMAGIDRQFDVCCVRMGSRYMQFAQCLQDVLPNCDAERKLLYQGLRDAYNFICNDGFDG